MEGNTFSKVKKKFLKKICIDILKGIIIIFIIILALYAIILLIYLLKIIFNNLYLQIALLIIAFCIFLYGLYGWIKSTWKKSREEVENE